MIPLAMNDLMYVFWDMLEILQIIAYIQYLNVDFPLNIKAFFETFNFANFDFLPNYFEMTLTYLEIEPNRLQ